MAAAITTRSTTLEGQLLEILQTMQIQENLGNVVTPNTNNIVSSGNHDNGIVSGTFNIQVTESINSDGQVVTSAIEYITPLATPPST